MEAQRSKEASEMEEGPLKFAESSIDRICSVAIESSSRSASRMKLRRLHAARDVGNADMARDVRSMTRTHDVFKVGC